MRQREAEKMQGRVGGRRTKEEQRSGEVPIVGGAKRKLNIYMTQASHKDEN